MISPPVQLAAERDDSLSISPKKAVRTVQKTTAQSSAMQRPASKQRLPLSEFTALQPPSSDAQLLPDGGRGSPVKGACTSTYLPPPTFSAHDIRQHISSIQKARSKKTTNVLITPKTSPLQPDFSPPSPVTSSPVTAKTPKATELEIPPDNGCKPAYSYATLIGMAILKSSERKLTLSAIYNWISSTFSYYSQSEAGWQNSIRHNLSLNKAFVKVERPKDEPGKGHYWTVEAGCEGQFLKTRVAKKLSASKSLNNGSLTATMTTKKDGKKRHVEFEDVPKMKRIMISPAESNLDYDASTVRAPASPPPTDDKRKRACLWEYDDSGYFSPTTDAIPEDDPVFFDACSSRSAAFSRELSYSANALDLVLSPPPSSSPVRNDRVGLLGPRTPASTAKRHILASPGTTLREHRQHMLQMLTSPDTDTMPYDNEDDPWLTDTPKPREDRSLSMLDSPWDEVAERAAFGSPDKRESRRRESRRSLVCGLHAQELYETGFESSNMPGVNVLDIMRREVERVKGASLVARPSLMERSQSSMW